MSREQMHFTMRAADVGDAPTIFNMIDDARMRLKEDGVDQWQGVDPTREEITADILRGNTYLFEEEGVVATAVLAEGIETTYQNIDGSWLDEKPYITVHRFVVLSDQTGRGIGRCIMEKIKAFAASRAVESIRIDTHKDNTRMRRLIESSGFEYCGVIIVADGTERIAYQWRNL